MSTELDNRESATSRPNVSAGDSASPSGSTNGGSTNGNPAGGSPRTLKYSLGSPAHRGDDLPGASQARLHAGKASPDDNASSLRDSPATEKTLDTPRERVVGAILRAIRTESTRDDFVSATLPHVLQLFGGATGGLVSQHATRWRRESWIGESAVIPEPLVIEAIDRGEPTFGPDWCVIPFGLERGDTAVGATPSAIVMNVASSFPTQNDSAANQTATNDSAANQTGDHAGIDRQREIVDLSGILVTALQRIDTDDRQKRRIRQQSVVLAAAAQWQQIEDDVELLHAIADTATKILKCERASIFLWDKRGRKLVGRPALGVDGGKLVVDAEAGIVGEVIATQEPKIWNTGSDSEKRVNRKIDHSIGFETRSLVAVPMRGDRKKLVGVFEALNHRDGGFDEFDVAALQDLATHAAVAIEGQRTRRTLSASRDRLVDDAANASPLVGNHPSIQRIRGDATKVAETELSVLILGENGTGKEVLARHIHYHSKRRSGPFVAVNCAALVESLLESELFGHEKGAFTDAARDRPGKFELASGGTLFLDEIGDMSPGGQAKLLRVLEEKVIVRVGGSQTIPVDVRVIAATNQPLDTMIAERRFREDLFFRLNVVSLTLPPLRQRGDDILGLATHFLTQFCREIGRSVPQWSDPAVVAMLRHPWAGNVRELRNTVERISYLCSGNTIQVDDLMLQESSTRAGTPGWPGGSTAGDFDIDVAELSDATRDFQISHIESAIAACRGNMTDAAARLGLHRSNLYRKMRQLGMQTSGE